MQDLEKSLAEIRKEIIEARNLVIRNDNLLKSLGSDLKAISKRQDVFESRRWVSAAVAYVLFAVFAAGGAFLASRGYVALARAEIASLQAQAEEATAQAQQIREELEATREASAAALAAYQRLEAKSDAEREEAAFALQEIDRNRLSPLEARALDDRGREVLQSLSNQFMDSGRAAFRRKDWRRAADDLQKAMTLWPEHPSAADNSFFLGAAAMENRDYSLVVESLRRFISEGTGRHNKDYAHLLLANAHEALGDRDEAQQVLLRGISNYPSSQFLPQMRRRLASIRRAATQAANAQ